MLAHVTRCYPIAITKRIIETSLRQTSSDISEKDLTNAMGTLGTNTSLACLLETNHNG